MSALRLHIAEILFRSEVNGPGLRSVIWVQGCGKKCSGCCNPDFLPQAGGISYTPGELAGHISANTHEFRDIEGITFSGGEPFDQAETLLSAADEFRRNGLSLMAFTGYRIAELREKNRFTSALLGMLDILVDGEYIESLACDRLWRSSFNQNVHFLSNRYRHYEDRTDLPVRECEMTIDNGRLVITGFPVRSGESLDLFHSLHSQR